MPKDNVRSIRRKPAVTMEESTLLYRGFFLGWCLSVEIFLGQPAQWEGAGLFDG